MHFRLETFGFKSPNTYFRIRDEVKCIVCGLSVLDHTEKVISAVTRVQFEPSDYKGKVTEPLQHFTVVSPSSLPGQM